MEGVSVHSSPLPNGDAGTRKTLVNMQRLAELGSRNIQVREAVISVVRNAGARPHDIASQVGAWFRYVRDRIYFLHDPVNTEWLQAADYTLRSGAGDCDDRAILLAAGLRSFGVPAAFKVVAVDPRRPQTFSHVYVVASVNGRSVPLDATYPDNTMGTEPPRSTRTWMVPA